MNIVLARKKNENVFSHQIFGAAFSKQSYLCAHAFVIIIADLFLHLANNYVHAHMVLLSISELFCFRKKLGRALFHAPEPWWKWQSILEVLIQIPSEIYLFVLAGAIDYPFILMAPKLAPLKGFWCFSHHQCWNLSLSGSHLDET